MQNHPPLAPQRPRSPRFPFIPLKKALAHIQTLHQEFGVEPVGAPKALKALGFDALSGRAYRVLAALRAYGLITREREKGIQIRISGTGAKLIHDPKGANLATLRLAALEPRPFRRIWFNRPGITEQELANVLARRAFTGPGAQRAARVYTANVRYAQLEDPAFRESNDIAPPPGWKGPHRGAQGGAEVVCAPAAVTTGPAGGPQRLRVPLGDDFAAIPIGLSKENFQLLMQTLRLWRGQIIAE